MARVLSVPVEAVSVEAICPFEPAVLPDEDVG